MAIILVRKCMICLKYFTLNEKAKGSCPKSSCKQRTKENRDLQKRVSKKHNKKKKKLVINYSYGNRGKYTDKLNLKKFQSEIDMKLLLESNNLFGFKQNRSIGPYYADFFNRKRRVVIEVDGAYHERAEQKELDLKKDKYYHSLGLRVLRIKYPFNQEKLKELIFLLKH